MTNSFLERVAKIDPSDIEKAFGTYADIVDDINFSWQQQPRLDPFVEDERFWAFHLFNSFSFIIEKKGVFSFSEWSDIANDVIHFARRWAANGGGNLDSNSEFIDLRKRYRQRIEDIMNARGLSEDEKRAIYEPGY